MSNSHARCNCENLGCEHKAAACANVPGKARALYIGPICDGCAARLPHTMLSATAAESRAARTGAMALELANLLIANANGDLREARLDAGSYGAPLISAEVRAAAVELLRRWHAEALAEARGEALRDR